MRNRMRQVKAGWDGLLSAVQPRWLREDGIPAGLLGLVVWGWAHLPAVVGNGLEIAILAWGAWRINHPALKGGAWNGGTDARVD